MYLLMEDIVHPILYVILGIIIVALIILLICISFFNKKTFKSNQQTITKQKEDLSLFDAEKKRLLAQKEEALLNNNSLYKMVTNDPLTGLNNRSYFLENVKKTLNENPDMDFYMVSLDIKKFRIYNEVYGAKAGDALLVSIGNKIEDYKGKGCIYGRMEGDHFVLLIPEKYLDFQGFTSFFVEFLKNYSPFYVLEPFIGFYKIVDKSIDVTLMVDRAYLAAREVKNSHIECHYAIYDTKMSKSVLETQLLEQEADDALANGEFVIYFQPQYSCYDRRVVSAEALVRWNHPKRGLISPGIFIPIFERNLFITKLDKYVLAHTCEYLANLILKYGEHFIVPVSVNLSRKDLYNPNLVTEINQALKKYKLNRKYIAFEITESAYTEDSMQIINVVNELKKNGYRIEMDDFGSGYSSLNILKDVSFDGLKLDMEFIKDSKNNPKSANVVNSVIRMARFLNLDVIAEGVEEEDQFAFLKSIGCNTIQGFLFSKPVDGNTFENILKKDKTSNPNESSSISSSALSGIFNMNSESSVLFNDIIGPAGIVEFSSGKLEVVRLNDDFFKEINTPREDFTPYLNNILDILTPKSRFEVLEHLEVCVSHNKEVYFEAEFYADSKKRILNVLLTLRPIVKKGLSTMLFIRVLNISYQKKIDLIMLKTGSHLDKILNEIPANIGIFSYDGSEYKIEFMNKYLMCMFNMPKGLEKDFTSINILTHVVPEDVASLKEAVNHLAKNDDYFEFVYRVKLDDGIVKWVHQTACMMYLDGNYKMYYSVYEDITELKKKENLRQIMQDNIASGIAAFKTNYYCTNIQITSFSNYLYDILSYTKDTDVIGKSFLDYIHPDDVKMFKEAVANSIIGQTKLNSVIRMKTANGDYKYIKVVSVIIGQEKDLFTFFGVYSDVTLEHEKDSIITDTNLKYENLLNTIPGGVGVFEYKDNHITATYLSDGVDRIFGYPKDGVMNKTKGRFLDLVLKEDYDRIKKEFYSYIADETLVFALEFRILTYNNIYKWVSLNNKQIAKNGTDLKFYSVFTDVQKIKSNEEFLLKLANFDQMTGALNRAPFTKTVDKYLSLAHEDGKYSIAMFDIDNFKDINDTYGHPFGDKVIVEIVNTFKKHINSTDKTIIGRLGGDEFAVFFEEKIAKENLTEKGFENIMNEILSLASDKEHNISISMGIYPIKATDYSFKDVFAKVDKVLYKAKSKGKNSCCVALPTDKFE